VWKGRDADEQLQEAGSVQVFSGAPQALSEPLLLLGSLFHPSLLTHSQAAAVVALMAAGRLSFSFFRPSWPG
jgi:hypothetical protein